MFKGGTCLKKCYFETYRFSEDLDFSLHPTARYTREALLELLRGVARSVTDLSGVEIPLEQITLDDRHNKQGQATWQARLPYRGPLGAPQLAKILFDITQHELIADEPDERTILHPYPDELPADVEVVTYSIEELLAEKTRALLERTRPRDLYDVLQIHENHGDSIDLDLSRSIFQRKCGHKSIAAPTPAWLAAMVRAAPALRADWENMLAHQLPVLPPLDALLSRIDDALAWLAEPKPAPAPAGPVVRPRLPAPVAGTRLIAPPSLEYWGSSAPIEKIRFAGANRLLVRFTYNSKPRLAEPYSLRRAAAGHVTLFAWVQGDAHIKQFKIDEIHGLEVTDLPFTPRYAIELTGSLIPSEKRGRKLSSSRSTWTSERRYVFRCIRCDREFEHQSNNPALRAHKDADGYPCSGRRGYLERID